MNADDRPAEAQRSEWQARVQAAIREFRASAGSGAELSDEQVVSRHPEIAGDLVDELRRWRFVENARRLAHQPPAPAEPAGAEPATQDASIAPGLLPGYHVLDEIHRGGQGVVYRAIQQSTGQQVAIKVLRCGPLADAAARARFEREIEILGQLRHPHIVTIHDSGSSDDYAYFVMDYIEGQPLDRATLGVARGSLGESSADAKSKIQNSRSRVVEILGLFVKVCEAVNAAHLRGVIHRDLKPGNIRVDPAGDPHILDFGLARLSRDDAALDEDSPSLTRPGQFVGSLFWASPEQVDGRPDQIDIRTDVYSLGVILYHMLTGCFPYDVRGSTRDVLDRIANYHPLRPSVVAAGRAGASRSALDDEIDTIVLKCLSKERERRYQSAGELAREVSRYLAGEPIEAKRESTAYVLRKLLGRHKAAAGVAAGFVLLTSIGLAVSLHFWHESSEQRDRAVAGEADANRQTARAEAVQTFLQEMLAAANPQNAERHSMTVREALDAAGQRVEDGEFQDNPEVEIAVRTTIGHTYRGLGLLSQAAPHLQAALELSRATYGPEHHETAVLLDGLGGLALVAGDSLAAEAHFRASLALLQKVHGEEHPTIATSRHHIGAALVTRGDYAEAVELLRPALEMSRRLLGEEHQDTAVTMDVLGLALTRLDQHEEAEKLLVGALALMRTSHGADSMDAANCMNNLASLYLDRGQPELAEPLWRESLNIHRNRCGDDHPQVAMSENNLALLLQRRGDYAGAEPLFRDALRIARLRLGEEHPSTATAMNNLAHMLYLKGDHTAAEPICRQALALRRRLLDANHPHIAQTAWNLADLLRAQGREDEALPLYREANEIRATSQPAAESVTSQPTSAAQE